MYQVFLDKLLLPVAPEAITMTINNRNTLVDLINDGQVNIIKSAGLTDVSFKFMIPHQKYPFATYTAGFLSQKVFIETIEKLKTDMKPFQFILVRVGENKITTDVNLKSALDPFKPLAYQQPPYTNLTVTLEDYTIEEDANNGLDIYINVNLKQYKKYETQIVNSSGEVVRKRG